MSDCLIEKQQHLNMVLIFEKELGIKGGKVKNVRDLWLHQDLGAMSGRYSVRLEPHSCKVLRIKTNSKRYKAAVASLRNGAVINR